MKSTSLHSASEQTGAYLQTINQKLEENTSRLGSYQKTSMLRIERKKDAKKTAKTPPKRSRTGPLVRRLRPVLHRGRVGHGIGSTSSQRLREGLRLFTGFP